MQHSQTRYSDTLDTGISSSATSFDVAGTPPTRTEGVITIGRVQGNAEDILFDGVSGNTVTISIRGLSSTALTPTEVVGNKLAHNANESVEITTHHLYDANKVRKDENETITGENTFSSTQTFSVAPKTVGLKDANGNETIDTPATSSAVNQLSVQNAATGDNVIVTTAGGDTNINLELQAKGSGVVILEDGAETKTNAAPTSEKKVANKKYVDDQVASVADVKVKATSADTTAGYLNDKIDVSTSGRIVKSITSPAGDEKVALTLATTLTDAEMNAIHTGISANVTGTNLATQTAGATSNADTLHTHNNLVPSFNIPWYFNNSTGVAANDYHPSVVGFSDAVGAPIITLAVNNFDTDEAYLLGLKTASDIGAALYPTAYNSISDGVNTVYSGLYIGTDYWGSDGESTSQCISKNGTDVTISGTAPSAVSPVLGHDPTNSYLLVKDTTTTIKRYSGISGTTITFVSTITLANACDQDVGFVYDNTNQRYICADKTNNLIRVFSSSGTLVTSVAYTFDDTNLRGLCFIGSRLYAVIAMEDIGSAEVLWFAFIPTTYTR